MGMDKLRVLFLLAPLLGILTNAAGAQAYPYDAPSTSLIGTFADSMLDASQAGYDDTSASNTGSFSTIEDWISILLGRNLGPSEGGLNTPLPSDIFRLRNSSVGNWILILLGRNLGPSGGGPNTPVPTPLPTPLPSSVFLFGSGILGLLGLIRKVRYKF
ncbi:conserved hypothetical protein [delta proteobacterium NaphS2]|nr:conserved hypothetical protein [delta proteobacterium NaphS2]